MLSFQLSVKVYKSAVLNLWDNVVLLSVDLLVTTLTILEKFN